VYFGLWGAEVQGAVFEAPGGGGGPVAPVAASVPLASDALSGATDGVLTDACSLYVLVYDATYSAGAGTLVLRFPKPTHAGLGTTAAAQCP
jgi:hypothetical protein